MTGLSAIEEKLITIREKQVLLDRDVAFLYGVETKRVNEAVKNNADKFPDRYVINLTNEEWQIQLVENFDLRETKSGSTFQIWNKSFHRERTVYAGNHSEKSKSHGDNTQSLLSKLVPQDLKSCEAVEN